MRTELELETCFRCKAAPGGYENNDGAPFCDDCSTELCTRCGCHDSEREVGDEYLCRSCIEGAADAIYDGWREAV